MVFIAFLLLLFFFWLDREKSLLSLLELLLLSFDIKESSY